MKTYNEISEQVLTIIKMQVAEKSYKTQKMQIERFGNYLSMVGMADNPLSTIPQNTIESFFTNLATEYELDRPTIQKYFIVIRKVWKYAVKHSETTTIPFDSVEFPKKGKDMSSEPILPEHARILLPDIQKNDPQLYLGYLTQYYCFLRPGTELRLLKVRDINFQSGTICVTQSHAKNGRKRIVTMPNKLKEEYIAQGIDRADGDLYVFGKRHKPDTKPCSINMMRWRFNKFRDKYNMPKSYHWYSPKHSGASMLHDSRVVSMKELMDQLGHSRLAATEHYIKRISSGTNERIRDSFPSPY